MNTTSYGDPARTPGDLARYLDGELTQHERVGVERTLVTDAECAAALEELEAGARVVHAWASGLPEAPLPPPPSFRVPRQAPRSYRASYRAFAACLALVVGGGVLTFTPVGASLLSGLRAAMSWVTGDSGEPSTESPVAAGDGVQVSAPFLGARFSIEFRDVWPGGRLHLQPGPDGIVTARAPSGGDVELLFRQDRLVVSGRADPGEDLVVRVPAGVVSVDVGLPESRTLRVAMPPEGGLFIELRQDGGGP